MSDSISIVFVSLILLGIFFLFLDIIPRPEERKHNRLRYEREKCESPIEDRLFMAFVMLGAQPRTQMPSGRYRIDIALIRNGKKIAIECDGKEFHSSSAQKRHDKKKDEFLAQDGWTVIRVKGSEINQNAVLCAKRILKEIDTRPSVG